MSTSLPCRHINSMVRRASALSTCAAGTPACCSRRSSTAAATSAELQKESAELFRLREKLRTTLERELDEVYINGDLLKRLPGNLNMSFAYVEGESLLMGINDIAVSSGSACTSASLEPS